jgi:hypothetical protein
MARHVVAVGVDVTGAWSAQPDSWSRAGPVNVMTAQATGEIMVCTTRVIASAGRPTKESCFDQVSAATGHRSLISKL